MFLLWTVRVPVESCDVTLVPAAFALDATVIQKAARDELDSIDEKDLKYYRGLDKYMVGDFKLWCNVRLHTSRRTRAGVEIARCRARSGAPTLEPVGEY